MAGSTEAEAIEEARNRGAQGCGSLTVRSVRKQFNDVVAVDHVDLDLAAGEFVTLLGPSGSGKTTTLAIIAGFERPDTGSVILDGIEITHRPTHKRDLGVVFQNYALFPHMTVADNIAFPLKMRKIDRVEMSRLVAEALALVRLSGLEDRYPQELSGGQQQRVAVARATVYRPSLLLMDEPLSALDRSLREDLQSEIKRLHGDLKTSFLYVTHDQGEALALSDRIVLMHDGRIEQIGTPQEVYEVPRSVFSAQFLGQSNFLAGEVEGLEGGGTAAVRLAVGTLVHGVPSVPVSVRQRVIVLVRPENLDIVEPGAVDDYPTEVSALGVRVSDAMYLGESVRCRGTFETGEACTLHLKPEKAGLLVERGHGSVGWKAHTAVVLPAEAIPSPNELAREGLEQT